ncbi:MAG TPA: bile acid:sodium symporter, partial [Candidatus Bathyarchaeia archaeon]
MAESSAHLSFFEKYLAVWVIACMGVGLVLSQYLPGLSQAIDSWQIRGISVPIGICLFLMMYPALLNLRLDELRKLARNPRPIALTLFSNWVVAPLFTVILANIFLRGYDQLTVAFILLGSSPCTAMVLVWGSLADGNQEQNFMITSLNTVTIMVLYAPVVSILTGVQNIAIDRGLLAISVLVFIGLPLIVGYLSKRYLTNSRGEEWFQTVYRPAVGNVAIAALLTTLIVLFSLNGDVLLSNPDLMVLMSMPVLAHFALILTYNLLVTRLAGLKYR